MSRTFLALKTKPSPRTERIKDIPLNPGIADELEQLLLSEPYRLIDAMIAERIEDWTRKILSGRMSHDEYIAACQSIREAQYLRNRPKQLIHEARVTK